MKTSLPLLGGLTPQSFLQDYWHKQPFLIRQAIPDITPVLSRDALFQLARRDDVESRLITRERGALQMKHGPHKKLPPLSRKEWTLLVQGVNLHDDAADALLARFRFLPDARLDDLMISYATDGGGVGPHFDSYDVFLLQVHGQRRWQISMQEDLSLVEGVPLKILQNFQPEQEFVLEAGDMLYLPPHVAHDGIAVGECMTVSVGFRAPSWQELGEGLLQFMADTIDIPGRYADPDLKASSHPAKIGKPMLDRIEHGLRNIRFTSDDIRVFTGEYLSEPKPSVIFAAPESPLALEEFLEVAGRDGVVLARQSRMLYSGKLIFINGESFQVRDEDKAALRSLADARRLSPKSVAEASADVREALHQWYRDGWLICARRESTE